MFRLLPVVIFVIDAIAIAAIMVIKAISFKNRLNEVINLGLVHVTMLTILLVHVCNMVRSVCLTVADTM